MSQAGSAIRIHDLEPEDVKLFEKETGSVLRAMDFNIQDRNRCYQTSLTQ